MKQIPLSRGLFALVDDDDFEYLNQWKWYARVGRKTFYARRNFVPANGKRTVISMHRVIMQTPKGMEVDHRDGNGLNNQRSNIRNCTHADNSHNMLVDKKKLSIYKGVRVKTRPSGNKTYEAMIFHAGKAHYLGGFKIEVEAARAYDAGVKKYFGEFAKLNFAMEDK